MALPTGLIPVLVFVITIGVSVSITGTAHLLYARGMRPFHSGLRVAIYQTGFLYLVGVGVVWAIAGSGGAPQLWELPVALVLVGLVAAVILVTLPLVVGQRLIRYVRNVNSETALRYTTYGWPVAMTVVFGIFVLPGWNLFTLEGPQTCLVGFCGISVWLALAVFSEVVIAVAGPGLVGVLIVGKARPVSKDVAP